MKPLNGIVRFVTILFTACLGACYSGKMPSRTDTVPTPIQTPLLSPTESIVKVTTPSPNRTAVSHQLIATFTDLEARQITFAPNGILMGIISYGELILLDTENYDVVWRFYPPEDDYALSGLASGNRFFAFSPDSTLIATGGGEGKVYLLDTLTGDLISTFEFGNRVDALEFSSDSSYLFVSSCWDNPVNIRITIGSRQSSSVDFLACSLTSNPITHEMIGGSFIETENSLVLIDENSLAITKIILSNKEPVALLSILPDGRFIAVTNRGVKTWDEFGDPILYPLFENLGRVLSISSSGNGYTGLVTANGTVKIWDMGNEESQLDLSRIGVEIIALSPSGKQFAIGGPSVPTEVYVLN